MEGCPIHTLFGSFQETAMIDLDDLPETIDECEDASRNLWARPDVRNAIRKAAAMSGMDDTEFIVNVAYQAAMSVIERHEVIHLQPTDHEAFFSALDDEPAPPTEAMLAALRLHRRLVVASD